MVAADRLLRLAQIGGDFLALHHHRAPVGERGLLAVLGRQVLQLIRGMAQIIRFPRGPLHAGAVLVERTVCRAPCLPELLQRRDVLFQPGEGIEQPAVGRGIDQRALVVLAMDFDQRGTDRLQRLHGDRLIVEKGAGTAVGHLDAAQDHLAVVFEAVVGKDAAGRDGPWAHRTPR